MNETAELASLVLASEVSLAAFTLASTTSSRWAEISPAAFAKDVISSRFTGFPASFRAMIGCMSSWNLDVSSFIFRQAASSAASMKVLA